MFKPTRGPSKPTFKLSGINQMALVRFLEAYHDRLCKKEEYDAAFSVEMLADYFKNHYEEGKPLQFDPIKLGM